MTANYGIPYLSSAAPAYDMETTSKAAFDAIDAAIASTLDRTSSGQLALVGSNPPAGSPVKARSWRADVSASSGTASVPVPGAGLSGLTGVSITSCNPSSNLSIALDLGASTPTLLVVRVWFAATSDLYAGPLTLAVQVDGWGA